MTFRASLLTAVAAFVTLALVLGPAPTLEGQEARGKAALMNPADANEQAPATFRVNFDTSKGPFVVEVHRDWAPRGADRFYNLAKRGFYDGTRFYRVTDSTVQFGINGDPEIARAWLGRSIPDDPPRSLGPSSGELNPRGAMAQSNQRGFVAFTQPGANRRSTQVVIHRVDNSTLDSQMVPFGQIVSGINVVDQFYGGYGDPAPTGQGPMLNPYFEQGNAYLEKEFPRLDYINTATLAP